MKLYQRRCTQPLKWLLALVVFLLAMTVTFTDVYGIEGTGSPNGGTRDGSTGKPGGTGDQLNTGDDNPPPTAVPEPGTFILLAGGLGALYAVRHLRKRK